MPATKRVALNVQALGVSLAADLIVAFDEHRALVAPDLSRSAFLATILRDYLARHARGRRVFNGCPLPRPLTPA